MRVKLHSNHKWYNLNTQDLMPTWRWWITDQNDAVDETSISSFVKTNLTFDELTWRVMLKCIGKECFLKIKAIQNAS